VTLFNIAGADKIDLAPKKEKHLQSNLKTHIQYLFFKVRRSEKIIIKMWKY